MEQEKIKLKEFLCLKSKKIKLGFYSRKGEKNYV